MNDADLELQIRGWLRADAAALAPPGMLRRRLLDIPAQPATTTHWWHRFATLPGLSASVVAAGVLGIFVANMFFGLFDAPAGADGEPCNNRQVQQALDRLRDADGYRYVNREERRQIDPEAEISFDDPQYAWADAWTSEGAYLAPDRARDVPTATLPSLYNRGYTEHLQIDGHTYELRDMDGTPTWVESTNWPTANLVYGYVANLFPTFAIPGVTSLDWVGTPVLDDLAGVNGCTAAALLPIDESLPPGFVEYRVVALRVDVGSGNPTTVQLAPAVNQRPKDGQTRTTWELTWTTPSADEFVAPSEAVPDPNTVQSSFVPDPTPSPLPVDPSAWAPIELPASGSAMVTGVVAGDRLVAVGSAFTDSGPSGLIWTSTDGLAWETVDGDFDNMSFDSVAWDGSTYLAMAYRPYEPPEGPQYASERPETWLSSDGLTWERGGDVGPDETSGEVANARRLITAGPGWVASGAIWSLADNQQRPAFFTSRDGVRWETVELVGTGSGSMGRIVIMPDSSLFATGCESPGATNSGAFGEGCYMRPWRSDDGESWTSGAVLDVELADMVRWNDGLLAVGSDADPTQQTDRPSRLMTSSDGERWEPMPGFASGESNLVDIRAVGDQLVVTGQIAEHTYPFATAWRSTDSNTWEAIGLGLPEGAVGTFVAGVVGTPAGLALLGQAQVGDEGTSIPLLWLEP